MYVEKGRAKILSTKEVKMWLRLNREIKADQISKKIQISTEDLINSTAEEFVNLNNALLNDRDVWGERIAVTLREKARRGFQIYYMDLKDAQLVQHQFLSRLYLSCELDCMEQSLWGFFCSRNRKEGFLSDVIVATDAVFVDLDSMGGCYCQLVERRKQ